MRLIVRNVDLRVLNMRTRMPFRYGIATLTALPHLFVRLETEIDGRVQAGIAAEGLPPKWFTKDPRTTFRDDLTDMTRVIRYACQAAVEAGAAATVFDLWDQVFRRQMAWGEANGYPPLLSGLGASLVERALIDAFCRATATSFAAALRRGALGLDLGAIHPELHGLPVAALLPQRPLRQIRVRHTVGLSDPLRDEEIQPEDRAGDGLPQSLDACIRAYGLTHFKIKLSGDTARDLARLECVAQVIHSGRAGRREYAFTLDGNEQFSTVDAFRAAWETLTTAPSLGAFMQHLLFVEQPLHRDVSLGEEVARALLAWQDRPAIIIDESDGTLDSLRQALVAGYAGTSHKNCKGVFKGVANAALIAWRRQAQPGCRLVLSGEDLANVGPVALLQDLAAMASLGIEHVERNGHHYFAGLSLLPVEMQDQMLAHHGDLYRRHPAGYPALAVRDGLVHVGSVVDAPFGPAFMPDTSRCTPLDEWRFESLGIHE